MRILHLHSSFNPGGKELRAAKLMNAFGKGIEHAIVSAEPGAFGALAAIDQGIAVSTPQDFPPLAGTPTPGRLRLLARAMQGFDLVLSYNWGAMDGVMAHTVFGQFYRLPPLVHHEDGFNEDEAQGLKTSRNWYRRIALGRAAALVVPSQRLEAIALTAWQQPPARVKRIGNGIDTADYRRKPKPDALPRVVKHRGEKWLGTLAGLRAVKNLPRLVRAFASLPEDWQLVILGEGPERDAIRAEAMRLDIAHRVHLPGFVADPSRAVGLFDLFALSSDSEQFPISVVEAMAAGLAVASPAVGDVAAMLAEENRAFISPPGDEAALAANLQALAADPALRGRVGQANRARAQAEYDERSMVAAYRAAYAQALGKADFPLISADRSVPLHACRLKWLAHPLNSPPICSLLQKAPALALRPESPQSPNDQRQAAQQDVFLREVDDALRQDEMAGFFKRFGVPLIAAIVVGLLALAGYLWWDHASKQKAGENGEKLTMAIDEIEGANLAGADKQLVPLAEGGDANAAAAKLMRAGIALRQSRDADAVKLFGEVAADDDAPKPYRDLALIREIATNFDKLPPQQVIDRLKPLAVPGNPWFGNAGELVGIAYLKQGNRKEAGPLFAKIARDEKVPDTLRRRARQLAGLLGVDAVDDPKTAAGDAPPGAEPAVEPAAAPAAQ